MDPNQFVFVSLTVETNDTAADLAAYAEDEAFPWTFAVMTPDLLAALRDQFGSSIAVPPTQPHFIIRPDGTTTGLLTGNPAAEDLIADLNAANSLQ
jgi:cytochrome oxidase Cu insertion factor (SCO1/SenC/PrrC family)